LDRAGAAGAAHVGALQQAAAARAARAMAQLDLGRLRHHPSVELIAGFLCYKAGGPDELAQGMAHLERAAAHPLIARTARVLHCLCLFYTVVHRDNRLAREYVAVTPPPPPSLERFS